MTMPQLEELNDISGQSMRSMPYEQYFGEMDLTEKEKEERIELAEKLEDDFLFILSLVLVMKRYNAVHWDEVKAQLQQRYRNTLQGVIDTDDYIEDYIKQFAEDTVKTTQDNIDEPYTLSYDRARFMAENESLSAFNHQELVDAIAAGKKRKKWMIIHDKRVRHTHSEADGQTVWINEPFLVGNSLLLAPKDTSYSASASEIVNCRCKCKYY